MSGGGGGGGDDGVDYQREQEQARQDRIRQGMTKIDQLFNGWTEYGPVKSQKIAWDTYNGVPQGAWYDEQGNPITVNNSRYKKKTGLMMDTAQRGWIPVQDLYDSNPITSRDVTVHQGFDDSVFNKRATAYQDFAMPQVEQQYQDQQKALNYALARGGNLQSSLAANKAAELDKDYGLQRQAVIDKGQDYVNQGKADLASQKASAVSMLQATADPDAAYNVAAQSAQQLSQMPSFQPLDPVVKNVAAGLGTYLTNQQTADAIAKANAGGSYSLPSSWSGSGKIGR
jgi:hypothetical protein